MPHLCAFLQDESIPIGYVLSNGQLYGADANVRLFNFDLTESAESLADNAFNNCVDLGALGSSCWNVSLRDGKDRRDSIHHGTRGMWFDGKYDYLIMDGTLPPRMHINFWTKSYHDGTLFSVSGKYDEAN